MEVASLFAGIGGFEVGIKESNLDAKIVFASEIDIHARASYIVNFGEKNLYGDITKIPETEIPDHDLLVAGFPCQAFSIAGKQRGFNDIRGTLFFEVARILKEKQPKYFLLENVKNLVSHDNGNTFKTIIKTLNDLGYTIDFSIINSLEAGLPQNRERTYIVGILGGKNNKEKIEKRNNKINKLKSSFEYNGFNFFNSLEFHNPQKYIKDILEETKNERYLINNKNVKEFLKMNCFKENKTCVNKIVKLFDLPRNVWNDMERQRRVYSIYGISPTILARSDTAKIYISTPEKYIRKLTPKENFKLQGFNDFFIDNISRTVSMTQQYKQAGNAVSPPVITAIINHFISYMEDN
ncbi:DNA (cytosine-5-)-methyltransferase [bacterium]|nr:DNA (cytosine-5-)-methyltransferase [bacterium]